ncbi:MAG: cation:proton antiporter [Salinisphaera sp.]|nr:cation:proton antiporter [Salinisphaera sp.]
MTDHSLLYTIAVIFSGAALLATGAMFARQSLLVVYILLGIGLGAFGPEWTTRPYLIHQIANLGVVFLLFLLGLSMHPQNLVASLNRALLVTFASSLVFFVVAAAVALLFGLGPVDSLVIGVAMGFSSTIIGLKLLPSGELYRERTGELIVSVLLLQDLIAIVALLVLQSRGTELMPHGLGLLLLSLPGLIVLAFLMQRYLLAPLIHRFDAVQEYVFLVAVGWCMGFAVLAHAAGLSAEIGAFIAGVALAASASARFIARRLQPLRDFFLILFFFAVGAGLNLDDVTVVWGPALAIAALLIVLKPWTFRWLLRFAGEGRGVAREVGLRLGQASEFSLLVAFLAVENAVISPTAGAVVHVATVTTFIVSSFLVNQFLPTPSNPPVTVGDRH